MSGHDTELDRLRRLLQGSLSVWRLRARIEEIASDPPTILIRAGDDNGVYVTRRDGSDLPPCWEVRRTGLRGADPGFADLPARRYAAVPGMLRGVRDALEPDARAGRLVIGARRG